jgi:ATP-binding cassette, subfamily A (ABC1), member 3
VHSAEGLCWHRRDAKPEVRCDEDSDVEEEQRVMCEAQKNDTRGVALACIRCCPQSGATLYLLEVEEQLLLYTDVRGIPGDHWERLVSALCSLCVLTAYGRKVTRELFGGNRRKPSVAQSMIGGSRVLLLKEPTAGMDPVTRRGLWAAI